MSTESPPETERKSQEKPPKVRNTARNERSQSSWPALARGWVLDRPVPGTDVSPGRLSPQGCRHLLAPEDRRLDPPDGPGPAVRSLHVHARAERALDRPSLALPDRDQLGLSAGGVVALNVAKCVVTCVAMLLLVTARRREWPVWVMVLAWLPALLVLGGRMYVRPETLTLLYLSIFLAVILRWDRYPRLALLLPIVQVAWVNSHGLFVLGPILVAFGLIDAALRFGFFDPSAGGGGARSWPPAS